MAENLLAFHERIHLECKEAYGDNNNSDTSMCNPNQHSSLTLEQCFETVLYFKRIWLKIEQTYESMYNAAVREERMRNDKNNVNVKIISHNFNWFNRSMDY